MNYKKFSGQKFLRGGYCHDSPQPWLKGMDMDWNWTGKGQIPVILTKTLNQVLF